MNAAMIVDVVVVLLIFGFLAYQHIWLRRLGHTLPSLDHLPEPELADIYMRARPRWILGSLLMLVVIAAGLWRLFAVLWAIGAGGAGAVILLVIIGGISSYHTISYLGITSITQTAKKEGLVDD